MRSAGAPSACWCRWRSAIVLLGLFALVEGKLAADPLIPLDVFKMPALRAANLVVALLFAAVFGMWYFVSLFLQEVKGDDALLAGISFLPMTLLVFAASATVLKLVARFGVRMMLTIGMSLATIGFLILATVEASSSYWVAILPGGMLAALGTGWSLVPATIVAVKGVPPAQTVCASRRQHLALGRRDPRPGGADHARHLPHQLSAGERQRPARRPDQRLPDRLPDRRRLRLAGTVAAATLLRGRTEGVPEPATGRLAPGRAGPAVVSAAVAPNPRPIPRFIADTSQEGIPPGASPRGCPRRS